MNAEFIAMLDYLERERGIKREILIEAVSSALLSASKKSVGASRDLHIDIDAKTGEIDVLLGDVVGVSGRPGRARRGEPSLLADSVEVLSRNTQPLPDRSPGNPRRGPRPHIPRPCARAYHKPRPSV